MHNFMLLQKTYETMDWSKFETITADEDEDDDEDEDEDDE